MSLGCANRLALVKEGLNLFEHEHELECFLVAARAGLLGVAIKRLFNRGEVGERKFGVDDVDVVDRVNLAGDVDDVFIVKAAHDMCDGVALSDVGEELIAEAFTLARAGNEAGDVDEFDRCGHDTFGVNDFSELRETGIGHLNDADIGLDRAERIVFGGDACLGQCIENGRLPDIGESDDAAFQTHGCASLIGNGFAVR